MSKTPINMIGGGFQHSMSSTNFEPRFIDWRKDRSADISIHIDNNGIIKEKVDKSKKNFAWINEAKTVNSSFYNWCKHNIELLENNFILLFTHDVELMKLSKKFRMINSCGNWIVDKGIHNKTKLVSMIASNKVMCQEHKYRQSIVNKFRGKCDLYGRGHNNIERKEEGLNDYCFSITMENANYSNMFSEKITDALCTGTIPVYWGIDNIGDFFNEDGIIKLTDDFKIEDLSFELYESKIDAVKENFEIASNMLIQEDYIYDEYIRNEI